MKEDQDLSDESDDENQDELTDCLSPDQLVALFDDDSYGQNWIQGQRICIFWKAQCEAMQINSLASGIHKMVLTTEVQINRSLPCTSVLIVPSEKNIVRLSPLD